MWPVLACSLTTPVCAALLHACGPFFTLPWLSRAQLATAGSTQHTIERASPDVPTLTMEETVVHVAATRNDPTAQKPTRISGDSVTQSPVRSGLQRRSLSRASNATQEAAGSVGRSLQHTASAGAMRSGDAVDAHAENAAFSAFAVQQTAFLPTFSTQAALDKRYTPHAPKLVSRVALLLLNTAPRMFNHMRGNKLRDLIINAIPRGAGQVCFMNNPWSGLLMVAGLAINMTPQYTLFGVAGLVLSTVFAAWLRVGWAPIRSGLFGYNGILVGYSLPILMYGVNDSDASLRSILSSAFAVVLFSFLCVILTISLGNLMVPSISCPPFTLPFNISAMLYYLCVASSQAFILNASGQPAPHYRLIAGDRYWQAWENEAYFANGWEVIQVVFRGVSQVFLCDYWPSGVIVVCALALCSRISACMAVWGSGVGMLTGMFFGASKADIFLGLWGYNSVLACIAVGGMFFVMSARTFMLATACAFLCAVLQGAMMVLLAPSGVATLTMPFCLGTIVFVLVQRTLPDFIPVQLQSLTTPEEHLARAREAAREMREAVRLWKRINQCKERAVQRVIRIRRGMVLLCAQSTQAAGASGGTTEWNGLPASVALSAVLSYLRSTGEFEHVSESGAEAIVRRMVGDSVLPAGFEMGTIAEETTSPVFSRPGVGVAPGPGGTAVGSQSTSAWHVNGSSNSLQAPMSVNSAPAPRMHGWIPFKNMFEGDDSSDATRGGPNVVMLALEHAWLCHVAAHPGTAAMYRHKPVRVWRLQAHFASKRLPPAAIKEAVKAAAPSRQSGGSGGDEGRSSSTGSSSRQLLQMSGVSDRNLHAGGGGGGGGGGGALRSASNRLLGSGLTVTSPHSVRYIESQELKQQPQS